MKWQLVRCFSLGLALCLSSGALWSQQQQQQEQPAPPPAAQPNGLMQLPAGQGRRMTELGFGLFQQRCLGCHGNPAYERAPSPATLREMSPEHIYEALTHGVMKSVGDTLSDDERRQLAESVSGRLLGSAAAGDAKSMPNQCPAPRSPFDANTQPGWNGWGNGLANSRFQDAQAAGLTAESVAHLQLKWAFGYPDGTSAYGQPSIVGGRVFVGTDTGYVYSLDAASGCVYWSFQSKASVRNAMTVGAIEGHAGSRFAVFFGDLKANAYALDADSGKLIWTRKVDDHLTARVTAAPALYHGRLYVPISSWEEFSARSLDYPCCSSVGSVSAFDANSGVLAWKTYVIAQRPQPSGKNSKGVQQFAPAGASVWNTPTIDAKRNALYIGTGDATTYPAASTSDSVMALDLRSGKVLWNRQITPNDSYLVGCNGAGVTENCPKVQGPDWDIPMSPMLKTLASGRRVLLVGTKPGDILSLDPDAAGKVLWRVDVLGEQLAGDGPLPMPRGGRGPLWSGAFDERNVYFGLNAGGAAALRIEDGQRLWYTAFPSTAESRVTNSAADTVIPGVLFIGGSDGKLSALATADGKVLWQFDTKREFATANQVPAHGGSISSGGPVVADGMLFVGSGFGVVTGTPGNVLLAFSLQ
jgi:polyvinyl alcohol dehydrogenase (cytochrome)